MEGIPTTTQVLARIKEAEEEVERLLERARGSREAAVSKARQDALRHLRGAEDRAREMHQEIVGAATREAETLTKRLMAGAEDEVGQLEAGFEARLEEAKRRILALFERTLDAEA